MFIKQQEMATNGLSLLGIGLLMNQYLPFLSPLFMLKEKVKELE